MELLVGIGIFLSVVLFIEGLYFVFRTIRNPEKAEVKNRLKRISSISFTASRIEIERKKVYSEIPWLNRFLSSFRWTDRLNLFLYQAGTLTPLSVYILSSLLLAFLGFWGASWLTSNYFIPIIPAILLGSIPFFYIHFKKKKRMNKFQQQLPEALDLIARALKAGHGLLGGMKMVADEMGDPIATEFGLTVQEINLGADFAEALKDLSYRVDCPDLKFFVISIVLQRETGGNLVEILENIAFLVRERFKFQGRVRVLSAEGRLSAIILFALPFLVGLAFYFLNPKYIEVLFTDPIGRTMIAIALLFMVVGVIVIRKMIDIKV